MKASCEALTRSHRVNLARSFPTGYLYLLWSYRDVVGAKRNDKKAPTANRTRDLAHTQGVYTPGSENPKGELYH